MPSVKLNTREMPGILCGQLSVSLIALTNEKKKSNLHYTRDITPKRVPSGGAHLRGLVPGQHSSEETSQRWRGVGNTYS